jgi:transcriptional regulator with XRE-family HTH domain
MFTGKSLGVNIVLRGVFALCKQTDMEKLRTYLVESGRTAAELALAVGCGRSHISQMLSGQRLPSLVLAVAIERLTDGAVKPSDWVAFVEPDKEAS